LQRPLISSEYHPCAAQQGLALSAVSAPADSLCRGELGLITRDVALRTRAQTAVLAVWDPDDELVDVLSAWGGAVSENRLTSPDRRRFGFVGRVLDSGRAALEPINPEIDRGLPVPPSGTHLTHAAGAAVRPPGGPTGALCLGLSGGLPDDPAVLLWTLMRYAGLAALCLHDPGALEGLRHAGRLDGLTGLLNHAALRADLEREIARSARHRRPLSCCFIDLDRFKRVNDLHGHLHGSRVLTDVAAILRDRVRVGDTVGRYGGDEFVTILPDTDLRAAGLLADRLRAAIRTQTSSAWAREPLDASVGVAQWQVGTTVDELLETADHALRAAKRAGGGIVEGAGAVAGGSRDARIRVPGATAIAKREPVPPDPAPDPALTPVGG
jgi:diguanylate cyclase (GGDEF)-like protein